MRDKRFLSSQCVMDTVHPQEDSDLDSEVDSTALCAVAAAASCATLLTTLKQRRQKKTGGSRPGRKPNKNIWRREGAIRIDRDCFCRFCDGTPLFTEREFERRYRVPREIYEQLREGVCSIDPYFQQRKDAMGVMGATTDQKLFAAFRQLAYGIPADAVVEQSRLAEPTNLLCLKRFCTAAVAAFEDEWLRYPSVDEIMSIEERYATLGFPGCIGCVDCASWAWDNCPVGWQGQYIGKDKQPVIRMEILCDDNLRIWHVMFGIPGAKNDLSILNQSSLFSDIRKGEWPPGRPIRSIAGFQLRWFYYLVDGIYPDFRIFAKPVVEPRTAKEKKYAARQASARKAVERVFGVLFSQFRILYHPARLSDIEELNNIVKACCIIHNMVADNRGYEGTMKFRQECEEESQILPISLETVKRPSSTYEQAAIWREHLDPIEDPHEHAALAKALQDHIWNIAGNEEDAEEQTTHLL